jgi:hypothetical protein
MGEIAVERKKGEDETLLRGNKLDSLISASFSNHLIYNNINTNITLEKQ